MIEGSGPGRGVPWWRWRRVLILRHEPGVLFELGRVRPGRVIARVAKEGSGR